MGRAFPRNPLPLIPGARRPRYIPRRLRVYIYIYYIGKRARVLELRRVLDTFTRDIIASAVGGFALFI